MIDYLTQLENRPSLDGSNGVRVMFVFDSSMFRNAIAKVLSNSDGISLIAEMGSINEARVALESHEVDVIILGADFPDGSGLKLASELKSTRGCIKIVLLSSSDCEESFILAVRAGVDGYVLTSESCEQLLATVRAVSEGRCAFHPELCPRALKRLATGHSVEPPHGHMDLSGLSHRERQVVELLSMGMSNKDIANELSISISTTKTHVSRVFKRLGISHRHELLPRFMPIRGMNHK